MGFNEAVAKERAKREKRQAEMAQKVEEGKRKEEEKRKEMLSLVQTQAQAWKAASSNPPDQLAMSRSADGPCCCPCR